MSSISNACRDAMIDGGRRPTSHLDCKPITEKTPSPIRMCPRSAVLPNRKFLSVLYLNVPIREQ
jgi:hypothetical protein